MAILKNWLDNATALPAAFEAKFPKAPKLSTQLLKLDTMIPAGPTVFPNPPTFPTFSINKLPAPPNIFGSPAGYVPPSMLAAKMIPPPAKLPAGYVPPSMMRLDKTVTNATPAGGKTGEIITRRGY